MLCMEYMSRLFSREIENKRFLFHPRCKSLKISHLCFADDIMIFLKGSVQAAQVVKTVLNEFSATSGLRISEHKSHVFLCGVPEDVGTAITRTLNMADGAFPIRYLGVPLHGRGLRCVELQTLVEKLAAKVRGWAARNLSYAGRLYLVQSVLCSITCFWSSIFFIPQTVLEQVQGILRDYLWSGSLEGKRYPVAWDTLCAPKSKGGLDFKELLSWNKAILSGYLLELRTRPISSSSLWLQ